MADALRSLRWQTAGCPVKTLLVSHGSQPDTNERLSILCEAEDATLLTIGNSAEPWTKPLALNTGDKLKRTSGMLHAGSHLRPCYGSGGIQAARAVRKPETSLQRFGGLAGKIFAKVESGSTIESFH
jgi:hypothetical protein